MLPIVHNRVPLLLINWGQCRRKCSVESKSKAILLNTIFNIYFKLQIQACIIYLTTSTKMGSIYCLLLVRQGVVKGIMLFIISFNFPLEFIFHQIWYQPFFWCFLVSLLGFPIKHLTIYIFSFLLSQEKFLFSAKSFQFNVSYSHTHRVFTLQLYIRLSRS